MPLYSYEKATTNNRSNQNNRYRTRKQNSPGKLDMTLWEIIAAGYNDFNRLMTTSRIAALVIPTLLVVSGVYVIYQQVWPQVFQFVEEQSGYFDDNTASLVAGDYISVREQYSNPGAKYFEQLRSRAQSENLLFNDEKSANFTGTFELSIPSLELYDLRVESNVDSSVEAIYDEVLTTGLAHFEGTGLPITDNDTYNTVIYGHSSAGDYYERTKDPAAAFSRLSQIRYGDEIVVNIDGEEYKYKFIKGKVVDAADLSILEGQRGQKYLTLFTCYPNGNNGKRFVATARLVS